MTLNLYVQVNYRQWISTKLKNRQMIWQPNAQQNSALDRNALNVTLLLLKLIHKKIKYITYEICAQLCLRMFLAVSVTTVSCERSKLKIAENYSRHVDLVHRKRIR